MPRICMFWRIRQHVLRKECSIRSCSAGKAWNNDIDRLRKARSFSSLSQLAFPQPTIILFLSGILPEPFASAAGVRTKFLVEKLAQTRGVQAVHYGTGAKVTERSNTQRELEALGVCFHQVPPNDSQLMQQFLTQSGCHQADANVLVVFDRFYSEEYYSFQIHSQCPQATMVLDMQDMHALRWHRQSIIEQQDQDKEEGNDHDFLTGLPVDTDSFPLASDEKLQRELASIHRSDLTLVCSRVEMEALQQVYQIPQYKLCLASFFMDNNALLRMTNPLDFDDRKDFCFIGGFRHDPNVDAVWQMKRLWPRIQTALSANDDNNKNANFHVYGPFCPRSVRDQCHDPGAGFHIHGFADQPVGDILSHHRGLLAPLRYGAGIKGKILDAWTVGTPVVTTPIGSEGIGANNIAWGGAVAHGSQEFVDAAVSLHTDERTWRQAGDRGHAILAEQFGIHNWDSVVASLIDVVRNKGARRQGDYMRGVLWQQTLRSTEFFSRWIEEKNKK